MPDTQIYVQDYVSKPEKHTRKSSVHKVPAPPKIGNPTPLGLSAFALSTFILSFYNMSAFGINIPNAVIGVSLFTGGVVQFASGMWEFKVGNTFGGTGFSAFGGFWLSFGAIFIPSFGIQSGFGFTFVNDLAATFDDTGKCLSNCTLGVFGVPQNPPDNLLAQFNNALAVYCLGWFIFTFIFTLACIRTNVGVLGAFVSLTLCFLSLTFYHFFPSSTIFLKAGSIFCLITSGAVFYCLAAVLLTPDLSPISLPLWDLSKKNH